MEGYKRGSHSIWDCKYHLVWTTKYRYEVLGGEVGGRCRELLREIARSKELLIYGERYLIVPSLPADRGA
jgi:putative transposase